MEPEKSPFKRSLLIVLVVLFLLTISALVYAEWRAAAGAVEWWMLLLNTLILSIPLGLVFGSVYVLTAAWREHNRPAGVSPRLGKVIHWAPRVAAMLIIFFVSLFSLDVFEMQATPLQLLGAFLMHNIPALAMLLLLVFVWKRPMLGFVAFLALAIFIGAFFVRGIFSLSNLLLFVLPVLLVALLFYADWKWVRPPAAGPVEAAGPPNL